MIKKNEKKNELNFFSISKIFNDKYSTWKIPFFQRKYTWDEQLLTFLLNDIKNFEFSEKNQFHFFGFIIINKINNVNDKNLSFSVNRIIDGQQRITTSIILLFVFYQILIEKKQKFNIDKDKYEKQLLLIINNFNESKCFESDYFDKETKKKIEEVFKKKKEIKKFSSKKGKNIYEKNFLFLYNKLYKCSIDEIKKYLKNFLIYFKIGQLRINSDNTINEMKIFENINSKSYKLFEWDLIQNYILSLLEEQNKNNIDHILTIKELKSFHDNFCNINDLVWKNEKKKNEKINDFLRQFLEFEFLNKNKEFNTEFINNLIFNNFKEYIKISYDKFNDDSFDVLLKKLKKFSVLYGTFSNKKNTIQKFKFLEERIKNIKDINYVKLAFITNKEQFYFLLFKLFDLYFEYNYKKNTWHYKNNKDKNNKFSKILKFLNSILVRYLVIKGSGHSWTIDLIKFFKLLNKNHSSCDKLFSSFQNENNTIFFSDNKFKTNLISKSWSSTNIINVLIQINLTLYNSHATTKDLWNIFSSNNKNNKKFTWEHIMPKKISKSWKNDLMEDEEFKKITKNYSKEEIKKLINEWHENNLNVLGNSLIISNSKNSQLSNNTFNEKLKKLKETNEKIISDPLFVGGIYFLNGVKYEIPKISTFKKWNFSSIKKRNKILSKICAEKIFNYY